MNTRDRVIPRVLFPWALLLNLILLILLNSAAIGQEPSPDTDVARLRELSEQFRADGQAAKNIRFEELAAQTSGPMGALNGDPEFQLIGIDSNGELIIYATENLDAAITVGTNHLWPGGSSGLDLVGDNQWGELAIWDNGDVLLIHQEFNGRVLLADPSVGVGDHATHVAGTMVGAGRYAPAHGMSPAGLLHSYNWTDDLAEMSIAAGNGLRVSNHSYGRSTGWTWSSSADAWYWWGFTPYSETEAYGFGFYGTKAADQDAIAHAAPNYLLVKSAGNDRNNAGPAPGEYHWAWDPYAAEWIWVNTPRDPDGGATGYDTINWEKNSKNILTVGAVYDIPGGWTAPADPVMTSYSNWGPTDDGRIKPDLVANGVQLTSSLGTGFANYGTKGGTSMAAPNVSGSLNLLCELYEESLFGLPPRSATLKGVALHTADEAGPAPGPDYSFGWGLFSALEAARLIEDHAVTGNRIVETVLNHGSSKEYIFYSDGAMPIALTICWTDLPGTPPPGSLDPPDLMLVNDLDLRLERMADATVYRPWILDPANPAQAASTGDNFRDNVERIDVASPDAGWYRVTVGHKGSLVGGQQYYSLIQSGLRQVFHVASGGDDTLPGTDTNPYATIQNAVEGLVGAGEIVVHPGIYDQAPVNVGKRADIHGATGNPAEVVITGGGFNFLATEGRLAHVTVEGIAGPAVHCNYGAAPLIEGCVFRNNTDPWAGGVQVNASSATVQSCTMVGNLGSGTVYASEGGEIILDRTIIAFNTGMAVNQDGNGTSVTLVCCDLYENSGGDWVGPIAPQVDVDGNFSADPCFCDLAGGDLTLSADSWARTGGHPWGCDDLVGALPVGCSESNCGGVVPTFLSTLDIELTGDQVRIGWTARGVDDPASFRLTRKCGSSEEDLTVTGQGQGRFQALDRRAVAEAMPDPHYLLYHNDGSGWALAAERAMDLDTPRVAARLVGATPNPFNPHTDIAFTLGRDQHVRIAIYDVTGRRVAVLGDEMFIAGDHAVEWLGRDEQGREVSSGTYFAHMETEGLVQSVKLTLLR